MQKIGEQVIILINICIEKSKYSVREFDYQKCDNSIVVIRVELLRTNDKELFPFNTR